MDNAKLQKAMAQIALAAKNLGKVPPGKETSAFAELIVETIEPNHLDFNVFSTFFNVRNLKEGDVYVKKLRRTGHPVRTLVPETELINDPFYPPVENYVYNLEYIYTSMSENYWDLQRGELGTLEFFRSEMEKALVDELIVRVYALISQVWNGLTTRTNYVDATSTGLTVDIMDNMVETVSWRTGQRPRAIVGTHSALMPLYKQAGIIEYDPVVAQNSNGVITVPEIIAEWRKTGRIASFRGIPIVELPQVFRRTSTEFDKPLVDMSRVVVVGENAGEVVLYGGVNTQEYSDMRYVPGRYQLTLWRKYGMMIDMVENIGVIKVNGTPYTPYSVNHPEDNY